MRRWPQRLTVSFLVLCSAGALAAEGRIEISHTRALAGGVTPGDGPGYPVTLTQPGSYVLTSDLAIPSLDTNGIAITTDDVAIDLAGFTVRGPNTCLPGACASAGAGIGIGTDSVLANRKRIRVHGGQIIGAGGSGISVGDDAEVTGMLVTACGGNGIVVGARSLVHGNRSVGNREAGAILGTDAGFVGNVFAANSLGGSFPILAGGVPIGGNACDAAACSPRGARRFYLTTTTHNGAAADSACGPGSHMASYHELRFGSLEYDTTRGFVETDSGSGPPTQNLGWIRTGASGGVASGDEGRSNCNGWTSAAGGHFGSQAGFNEVWFPSTSSGSAGNVTSGPIEVDSMRGGATVCSTPLRVWCIED